MNVFGNSWSRVQDGGSCDPEPLEISVVCQPGSANEATAISLCNILLDLAGEYICMLCALSKRSFLFTTLEPSVGIRVR